MLLVYPISFGFVLQVLVSNGPCKDSVEETCVKSVMLIFEDHTIVLGAASGDDKVTVFSDCCRLFSLACFVKHTRQIIHIF